MASAGLAHTALLRSDGKVALTSAYLIHDRGHDIFGTLEGDHYKQVSAGGNATILLSTAGKVRFVPPGAGLGFDLEATYSHVSAALGGHFVLLKDDGKVIDKGIARHIDREQVVRALKEHDSAFVRVAAGTFHTVALSKDGRAVAYGSNTDGQCNLNGFDILGPTDLPCARELCTHVSAGHLHTVLVTTEGKAIAVGNNDGGQCQIPVLADGVRYIEASAGFDHTVLLRSDGQVVAVGNNKFHQCAIPTLTSSLRYLHVSAGSQHTVLVRSDGAAVSCGNDANGQCTHWLPPFGLQSWSHWLFTMPVLKPGITYVDAPARPSICAAPVMNISIRHVRTRSVVSIGEDEEAVDVEAPVRSRLHIQFSSLGGFTVCNDIIVPVDITVEQFRGYPISAGSQVFYKAVLPNKCLLDECPGEILLHTFCGEEGVPVPSTSPISLVHNSNQLALSPSLITILVEETNRSPAAQAARVQALRGESFRAAPARARVAAAAQVPLRHGGPVECEEPEGEAPATGTGAAAIGAHAPHLEFEPCGGVGWRLGEEGTACEEPETEDNL